MPAASSIEQSTISTNSTVDEYCRPGGSKSESRRGRKRNSKPDKRYIDYISDEDFSTFIDYDGADLDSDEWKGSDTSEDNDVNDSTVKKGLR